jgi:hypothetical protein
MRTTIHLNDDLFARLKEVSAKSGRTMTSIIEDALRQSLAQPRKDRPKQVRLTTFGGKGLKPGVDLDDSASLLDLMDRSR